MNLVDMFHSSLKACQSTHERNPSGPLTLCVQKYQPWHNKALIRQLPRKPSSTGAERMSSAKGSGMI
jgi:hypothetical protein